MEESRAPWPFRRALLQWAARRTLLAPSAPADAIRLTLDEIHECRVSTIQSDVAIGRAIDVEDVARRLRVPTLILCGGRDELTPPPLSQRLGITSVTDRPPREAAGSTKSGLLRSRSKSTGTRTVPASHPVASLLYPANHLGIATAHDGLRSPSCSPQTRPRQPISWSSRAGNSAGFE